MSGALTIAHLAKLAAFRPGYAYILRNSLYLSLTDRNTAGLSLMDARGPSFTMPADSGFSLLGESEPSVTELVGLVDQFYEQLSDGSLGGMGELDRGVCFAGAGEPLIRVDDLLEIVRQVKARRNGVPFRINTNGLVGQEVAESIVGSGLLHKHEEDTRRETGIDKISVFLPASDPKSFAEVVRPKEGRGFGDVCGFITTLAEAGATVECTTVGRPGVDTSSVAKLGAAFGAQEFRIRSFYP